MMNRYPDSHRTSQKLFQRAQKVLPGGNTRTTVLVEPFPVYLERGEGCRVWDVDGNVYYDCISNFTSMIHGYGAPSVLTAIAGQIPLGTAFGAPTASEIELAELLVERLPSADLMRFTNSGTEAVMMAIKAARAFTGRPKIVKIEGAYHGSYDFAEVSLDSSPANWGDAPASTPYSRGTPQGVLDDVLVVPFNDAELLTAVLKQHGKSIAAVLIDPMPSRAGLVPARRDYVEAIFAGCRLIGALVVFDEVISFRLGYSGAQGIWGVMPDLTALGKIIGGGFPVGAVGGRRDVMQVFDGTSGKPALPHGGTFTANPVTMRAGLATMKQLTPAAFTHLDKIGERMRAGVNAALAKHKLTGQCVGLGSLLRVHFTSNQLSDYRSAYLGAPERRKLDAFYKGLLSRGVLIAPHGLVALSTPVTAEDVDVILAAMDETLQEIACGQA
jgi:glutamate-1-semialdehyde 2,1-aminomutase